MISTNRMTCADNTERGTRLDLYDLYEIGIALLDISVRVAIRPSYEDKSVLSANDSLLYATTRSVSRSSFGMHMNALLS